jgi:hypothetical protein
LLDQFGNRIFHLAFCTEAEWKGIVHLSDVRIHEYHRRDNIPTFKSQQRDLCRIRTEGIGNLRGDLSITDPLYYVEGIEIEDRTVRKSEFGIFNGNILGPIVLKLRVK